MHIAIYEPDEIAAHILAFVARRRGHRSAIVSSHRELHEPLPIDPVAIIAAVDLVDDASLAVLQPLRKRYPEALLFVTPEAVDASTGLAALKAGVADVVPKPYHPHEVMLRAELMCAQRRAPDVPGVARVGDIEVNFDRYSATKAGVDVPLTKLELRLLYCLLEHHPQVAPIDRLLTFGWETLEPPDAALLKTHISHLRRKLQAAGGAPFEIRSRHSLGYTLELVEASESKSAEAQPSIEAREAPSRAPEPLGV